MPNDARFTEDQIAVLTQQLLSRWIGLRHSVVKQLREVNFGQFERPPKLNFLLAAMNETDLRERAIDSLGRVLRGLDPSTLKLDTATLPLLRRSLALAKAYNHPDFLIAACDFLLLAQDVHSISDLENLVERTTITMYIVRSIYPSPGSSGRIVRSFSGTNEEERNVRRVRSAAHVACERLKIVAEEAKRDKGLLRAAHKPVDEDLIRPAASSSSDPDLLLRSETAKADD